MENKLRKNNDDKVIAGVCSGIAKYFRVESWIIRAAFVLGILVGLSTVPVYIVLAIFMPNDY